MTDGQWSIAAEDLERLDALLASFLAEARLRCALLLDRTGRFLTAAGETGELDPTTFASLAAADFAASDQLAQLLGEADFSSLYHAGERQSMLLADVGGQAILAAIFDDRSTLGLVRLQMRALLPQVAAVFAEMGDRAPAPGGPLDPTWLAAAADEIDRLFNG